MTRTKRDTERKYEAPSADDTTWLPDLGEVDGVASVVGNDLEERDAVYYDTADLRLAGASATLRRRTGGGDAGWHLELPLTGDSREEVRAPLSDTVPAALRDLTLSRSRGEQLRPVVRIRSRRNTRHLLDPEGAVLAELRFDRVRAQSLSAGRTRAAHTSWTELDVELAEETDPALLDAVDRTLRESGIGRAGSPSTLDRALAETGAREPRPPRERAENAQSAVPGSAAEEVLRYVDGQVRGMVDLDPAVRRGLPDAVHRMRVHCRRLRSVLRTSRAVLARGVTDPIRDELKWLGNELGAERDQEVLMERFGTRIGDLPRELVLGPVDARLRVWDVSRSSAARQRTLDALRSPRYLTLLDSLTGLTEQPPLGRKAAHEPGKVLGKAVLKEFGRLAGRMEHALEPAPGTDRDIALHQARKAAKKTRYATEPARASLGEPAKRLGRRVKDVQKVLGEHQDSVVARVTLRDLALAAHAAGETGFTWGLLYGQEKAVAERCERELPAVWAAASKPGPREALTR